MADLKKRSICRNVEKGSLWRAWKVENQDKAELLSFKLDSLVAEKNAVTEKARLMNEIFNAEENHEEHLKDVAEQNKS